MQPNHTPGLADAQRLIDEKWFGLEDEDLAIIAAALASVDPEELRDHPTLLVAFLFSMKIDMMAEPDPQLRKLVAQFAQVVPHTMQTLQTSSDTEKLYAAATSLIIGLRMREEHERAARIGEIAQQRIDAVSARNTSTLQSGDTQRPGNLEVQRGLTATLLGDFSGAIGFYRRAVRESGPAPYRHFAGVNAAANSAMLAAIEGHHNLTLGWLEQTESLGEVKGFARHLTLLGAGVAKTLLAVDALDGGAAKEQLELIGPATSDVELWPFILAADIASELAFGDPHVAYGRFRSAGFTHGRDLTTDTSIDHLILRVFLDLLIGIGEGGMALRYAQEAGSPVRTQLPIARTHLLAGQPAEAARFASVAIHNGALSVGDLREAHGVLAVAQLRLGDADAAKAAFEVFGKHQSPYNAAMNRRLPQAEFEELQALTGLRLTGGQRLQEPSPVPLPLARLTPKEHEVLRFLADGLSSTQIAQQSGTSTHTVRTHVKNLYRKLGASSRAEAVLKAELTGLLGWNGRPTDKGA